MTAIRSCALCGQQTEPLLDFGPQPIAAHFPMDTISLEYLHPLVLGLCRTCGLAQLLHPVPPVRLTPPSWATYNEPEGHLDGLCDVLAGLEDLGREALVLGVTVKDDTTLARLAARGFTRVSRLEPQADLSIPVGRGFESVPLALTPGRAEAYVRRHGSAGLVMARHVLEHAQAPGMLLESLKILAGQDGYVVFEVPDCSRAFEGLEYAAVWEEHVLYFTEAVFLASLAGHGFELVDYRRHGYVLEDSLVAVTRVGSRTGNVIVDAEDETTRLGRFAAAYPASRLAWERWFSSQDGPVVLFGAGHHAVSFLNLLGLAHAAAFVVDANPCKIGAFLPGSRVPVLGGARLSPKTAGVCLLCANPAAEPRILASHKAYLAAGGRFASIFPGSTLYPFHPGSEG